MKDGYTISLFANLFEVAFHLFLEAYLACDKKWINLLVIEKREKISKWLMTLIFVIFKKIVNILCLNLK